MNHKNLKEIPERVREKLEKGKKEGILSKKLATIVRDVPIKIDYEEMSKWKVNSPEVLKLFEELGFKTLTNRVKSVGQELDQEKQGALF